MLLNAYHPECLHLLRHALFGLLIAIISGTAEDHAAKDELGEGPKAPLCVLYHFDLIIKASSKKYNFKL